MLHLKYAMLFPARLRVEEDGRVQFFEDPAAAWIDWRERLALLSHIWMVAVSTLDIHP